MRMAYIVVLALLLAGCDFVGGGETVLQGNGNLVVGDELVDRIAASLADFETTPEIGDDDLESIFTIIRQQALEGDLDAALVMLKLAGIQRQPEEPEE